MALIKRYHKDCFSKETLSSKAIWEINLNIEKNLLLNILKIKNAYKWMYTHTQTTKKVNAKIIYNKMFPKFRFNVPFKQLGSDKPGVPSRPGNLKSSSWWLNLLSSYLFIYLFLIQIIPCAKILIFNSTVVYSEWKYTILARGIATISFFF